MSKKKSTIAKIIKWFLPIAIIAGGSIYVSSYLKKQEQIELRKIIDKRYVKAEKKDIRKILNLSGKVLPASSISIYSPVSGQILEILVKEGDKVKNGQALFSVKQDTNAEKELENARADVERTKLEMKSAEENLNRINSVKDLFSTTEQQKNILEYDRQKMNYQNALNRLRLLENSLGIQGQNGKKKSNSLSTVFVKAPRDSFVTLISKSVGDAVIGTTNANQSTSENDILTLSDVQKMIVRIKILEADLELINIGMKVDIKLDAIKSKSYKGQISRISQQGIDDKSGGYTYFLTDIIFEEQDEKVRSQMNSTVQILLAEKKDVLTLPVDAVASAGNTSIIELPPEKNEHLTKDRIPKYKKIKIGLSDEDRIEIIDTNIVEGTEVLKIDFSKIDPKKLALGQIDFNFNSQRKNNIPGTGGGQGPGGRGH